LIGSAKTMRQAVLCLGPLGRAALVGLTAESMSIHPYTELINKEVEIIGVSDHLAAELPALIEFARSGKLRFPPETLRVVDLDSAQINAALDALQDSIDHVRTVIKVTSERDNASPVGTPGLIRRSHIFLRFSAAKYTNATAPSATRAKTSVSQCWRLGYSGRNEVLRFSNRCRSRRCAVVDLP
jgi:hypothetical protein